MHANHVNHIMFTITLKLKLILNVQLCNLRDRDVRKHYELQQVCNCLVSWEHYYHYYSLSFKKKFDTQSSTFFHRNSFPFVWSIISQRRWKSWADKRPKVQSLHQESGISVDNITIIKRSWRLINITLIIQDGYCDVALTSNTFDMGTGDNLSFGNNVQSGTTFGAAGSLTCE